MATPMSFVTRLVLTGMAVALVASLATVPVAGAAGESYVAIGDSYTAGPLIPNQLNEPLGCWRSDHDYPHLVAQSRAAALRDVSCSGATTTDLGAPQPVFGGANVPQLDALDAAVTTVTVQIGGNDVGFTEILSRCLAILPLGTPCQDAYTSGGVDEISRRIAATAPKVAAALVEIHRRSPHARVLVVGYPAILPELAPGCWPLLPIAPADVPYLRDKEKEMNAMLAAQAAAGGARYVDTYGRSIGHDACQLPGIRWIEPLIPLSPAAPVHPNVVGMHGMAAAVLGTSTG